MGKHIIEKLIDWECCTANEESEMLLEAVSYIDQLQSQNAKLESQLTETKERLAIKDDALTASMMIAEFTAVANVKLAEAVLMIDDNWDWETLTVGETEAQSMIKACQLAREIMEAKP